MKSVLRFVAFPCIVILGLCFCRTVAQGGMGAAASPVGPVDGTRFAQADEKKEGKAKEKPKGAEGTKKGAPAGKGDGKGSAKKAPTHDLETWGQIKSMKGSDFWTLTYTKVEKGRPKKETAFVKVDSEATFYKDTMIAVTDLKEGDKIWLFGKPFEQESPSPQGIVGVDRQIKNVSAIAVGEDITVNKSFKDPRDADTRWLEAEVTKAGASISASYDGQDYKVVMLRTAVVMRRAKGGDAKQLKNNAYVALSLDKTTDRPETKNAADEKKESYTAKAVVILDPRLMKGMYPLLFE